MRLTRDGHLDFHTAPEFGPPLCSVLLYVYTDHKDNITVQYQRREPPLCLRFVFTYDVCKWLIAAALVRQQVWRDSLPVPSRLGSDWSGGHGVQGTLKTLQHYCPFVDSGYRKTSRRYLPLPLKSKSNKRDYVVLHDANLRVD